MNRFPCWGFPPSQNRIQPCGSLYIFTAQVSCLGPPDRQPHSPSARAQNTVPLSAWLLLLQFPAAASSQDWAFICSDLDSTVQYAPHSYLHTLTLLGGWSH